MTTVIETSNGWGTPRAGGWPRTTSRQQRVRRADGQGGMWRKCDRASPPRQGSPMTGERSQVEVVSPFLGQGPQHGKAGKGGKLPLAQARVLKNGAATIGVFCCAVGRPWPS